MARRKFTWTEAMRRQRRKERALIKQNAFFFDLLKAMFALPVLVLIWLYEMFFKIIAGIFKFIFRIR